MANKGKGRGNNSAFSPRGKVKGLVPARVNPLLLYIQRSNELRSRQYESSRFGLGVEQPTLNTSMSEEMNLKDICINGFKNTDSSLKQINERLTFYEDVTELRFEQQQRDIEYVKHNMASKLEISGLSIPDDSSKEFFKLRDHFIGYAASINIQLEKHEIVDAYSIARKSPSSTSQIIVVQFNCPSVKFRVMKLKLARDKASNEKPSVFFNYVMPKQTRTLFRESKRLRSSKLIANCIVRDARVLIQLHNADDFTEVLSMEHFKMLVPHAYSTPIIPSIPMQIEANIASNSENA